MALTEDQLYACLASRSWARAVAGGADPDVAMDGMSDSEWLEAMNGHPRIGERGGAESAKEQGRAMEASASTLADVAAENRRYEEKFGHVFLIFASGRSADDILVEVQRRMRNDPATELEEAKRELRKITHLRLDQRRR